MKNLAEEYRTVTAGAGWFDRRRRGRLRFEGADAVAFLQALVTNDVAALAPGRGVYAAYLTPQGRMIADIELYHRGAALVGGVAPGVAIALAARFDGLIFAEDVHVLDVSAELAEIAVVGREAASVAARALGIDADALSSLSELGQVDLPSGFVARGGDAVAPMFVIFTSEPSAAIVERLERAGAHAVSAALAETFRVEAGRPAFGVDMNEDTIPLEAGLLDRAISTTKGCYVGQEIVIRILHRGGGRVARRLVTLAFDGAANGSIAPGAPLAKDGREIGRVTSVAASPDGTHAIGLGYVARDTADLGDGLSLGAAGLRATVTGYAR